MGYFVKNYREEMIGSQVYGGPITVQIEDSVELKEDMPHGIPITIVRANKRTSNVGLDTKKLSS